MKIGYLHISISQSGESGVTRYGRLIAAEASKRNDLSVIEASVILTEDKRQNKLVLEEAAKKLSQADIVHLQYNKYIWSGGRRQLYYLWLFLNHCSPPIIVTFHDLYPEIYPKYGLLKALNLELQKQRRYKASIFKSIARTFNSTLNSYFVDRLALTLVSKRAQKILLCTQEEARRIEHLVERNKIKTIPIYVEERSIDISPSDARKKLELDGFKIVTLQGFIYTNKGHQLAIEALSKLPQNVKMIFAGGIAPGNEELLDNLSKMAENRGLSECLRITGYLSEEDLECYLAATHLAICPFKIFSASASLSTWISRACCILASDLPQIAEYNQIEADSIHTFKPYNSTALAESIQQLLPTCQDSEDIRVVRLREKLSLPTIFNQYLLQYREIAKQVL